MQNKHSILIVKNVNISHSNQQKVDLSREFVEWCQQELKTSPIYGEM